MDEEQEERKHPDFRFWKVPTEIWTRIVGYLRPVQNFHPGKKQEYEDRVEFDVEKTLEEAESCETETTHPPTI